MDDNLVKIVLAVFGLLGSFASGSALVAFINARARKNVIESEAGKIDSESISTILSGAAGALFANMQSEMKRQGAAIKSLEEKVQARETEIDRLEEENRALHEENIKLKGKLAELHTRVAVLEDASGDKTGTKSP